MKKSVTDGMCVVVRAEEYSAKQIEDLMQYSPEEGTDCFLTPLAYSPPTVSTLFELLNEL